MSTGNTHLGLDFDNTIVAYDDLFVTLLRERIDGSLAADVPPSKLAIRDALRAAGREAEWTEMQGLAYGARILSATPAPGVIDFIERAHAAGVTLSIVSHKTRVPYAGPPVDLHAAARGWLEHHRLLVADRTGLTPERVWLEETKEAKARRIEQLGCTHFIDDLPEFLSAPFFPETVIGLHYAPAGPGSAVGLPAFALWDDLDPAALPAPDRCP